VDLEALRPGAESLADWVLAAEERERLEALAPAERGRDVVVCFSLKEAVVKALDPYLGRLAGLGEVRVGPRPDGSAVIDLRLRPGEGPFAVDARWLVLRPGLILTSVCARPLTR
jgi:4'-phosphopantetheinyl transferase EntD